MTRKQKQLNRQKVKDGHGLTCQDCGTQSADVKRTTCPFELEVRNRVVKCILCPECHYERGRDV